MDLGFYSRRAQSTQQVRQDVDTNIYCTTLKVKRARRGANKRLLGIALKLLGLLPARLSEPGKAVGEKVAFEIAPISLVHPPVVSFSRSGIVLRCGQLFGFSREGGQ